MGISLHFRFSRLAVLSYALKHQPHQLPPSHDKHKSLNHKINEAYWRKKKILREWRVWGKKAKISYKGEGSISFNQIFIYLLELRTLSNMETNKIISLLSDSYQALLFNARTQLQESLVSKQHSPWDFSNKGKVFLRAKESLRLEYSRNVSFKFLKASTRRLKMERRILKWRSSGKKNNKVYEWQICRVKHLFRVNVKT